MTARSEPHPDLTVVPIALGPHLLGFAEMQVDGYYGFVPMGRQGGYWPEEVMRHITDALHDLNRQWDYQVHHDLQGTLDLFP